MECPARGLCPPPRDGFADRRYAASEGAAGWIVPPMVGPQSVSESAVVVRSCCTIWLADRAQASARGPGEFVPQLVLQRLGRQVDAL